MKIVIIIISNLLLLTVFSSNLSKKFDKKIDKEVRKIWKTPVEKTLIQLPDSLKFSTHNFLFTIKSRDSVVGLASLNKVKACRVGGCNANNDTVFTDKYDHFYYCVIVDTNLTIIKVAVWEYESDYGYEITSRNWLKQFIGKNGNQFNYGEEIDMISGATVSATGLVLDIQMLTSYLESLNNNKSIF